MAADLKEKVREFWNRQSCDTHAASSSKFSKEYFEEIEAYRYFDQPFIHAFAQFSRYNKKKVLEVGFGAGTDFVQWIRAGAVCYGIDLTQEALDNLTHRIEVYHLPKPEQIQVGDAENLPFDDNFFDLGYSFGVLHHSPNTPKAIQELVRVVRPGGEIKIMLYNRRSIFTISKWVRYALLKGRPWKSLHWALWNYCESIGTKGYTVPELMEIFSALPLQNIRIRTETTSADYLAATAFPPLNLLFRLALRFSGRREVWKLNDFKDLKSFSHGNRVSGNPLGFFHCITARKIDA
jgi:ubiquinone/menaquinone biosynthesis C-methylase UbiE